MNKMFQRKIISYPSNAESDVSMFEDDSIEVVRQKIGISLNIHPDRLFILVGISFPKDYYQKDKRRWEALFERLSLNGDPIEKDLFEEYQLNYRFPNTAVAFSNMDKEIWMSKPEFLQSLFAPKEDFLEYRVLGVADVNSYILPLQKYNESILKIYSTRYPFPQNTALLNSFFEEKQIARFLVREMQGDETQLQSIYYPFVTSETPQTLSPEISTLVNKNSKLLEDLLKLQSPSPESISIIRTRFFLPLVETEFGSAIRTRFEQIFYGLTVSKKTPCISFFTSKNQVNRHKFFTENPNQKKSFLDMEMWNTWWNLTKPSREKPTLLLYRGKTNHSFDRIAITSSDIVFSTYRSEENKETLDELKQSMFDWFETLDAILPFITPLDYEIQKWELQDMSYLAKYANKLNDFDLLRFNCISNIFTISDKTKALFNLLRTDHTTSNLSAVEMKVLLLGSSVTPEELAKELSTSPEKAQEIIQQVKQRIEADPSIERKTYRGYPSLRVGPDYVIVSSVNELNHSLEYSNLLRNILSNPNSDKIDSICPKRVERVVSETTNISIKDEEPDSALLDEYADFFAEVKEEEEKEVVSEKEPEPEQRISTEEKGKTIYSYFNNRLKQFDPETFHHSAKEYPKKCEQKKQPIILSDKDLERLKDSKYNPENYGLTEEEAEKRIFEVADPHGKMICPEYWCMHDEIPLQESQLDKDDYGFRCPVCKGKLQRTAKDNTVEYPLVKRGDKLNYPGYTKYESPQNQKRMPCCYKEAQSKQKLEEKDIKYYILDEFKKGLQYERLAKIPAPLLELLGIDEKYTSGSRLITGQHGYFRVGMGPNPSETLPSFLQLKTKIPKPYESVKSVLQCSFLRTWKRTGASHLDKIKKDLPENSEQLARLIAGISEAFEEKELTKLQELEYSAMVLNCELFQINIETNTLSCSFHTNKNKPKSKGIIVLQNQDEYDILSQVERKTRGINFRSDIFNSPFKKDTRTYIEDARNTLCTTNIPSYDSAEHVMTELGIQEYSVVLDPFGRGQSFYDATTGINIPFQSINLPDTSKAKLSGYKDIVKLPLYSDMISALEKASKLSKGYTYKEDLYNSEGKVVELLLESGLRVVVAPIDKAEGSATEVIETTTETGESDLVFGESSTTLREQQKEISYSSEVYEFLLFQLSNDLETDNKELRDALRETKPNRTKVEPLLRKWFDKTTTFTNITEPVNFLSKIRTPCGQFKKKSECSGNLCGWDGGKCHIQIKQTIQKERLFHRLVATLLDNSKIRSIILDGRITPFFSSILYLELPHEIILTDKDL